MTIEEKFDKLFTSVEQKVKKNYNSASAIAEEIAQEFGMQMREMSCVFSFVSNQTLLDYIKERKMMLAYESIIESEKFNAEKAISLSGLSDQATFNKKFKSVFNLTPTEAFKKRDFSLLKIKLSWNDLQTLNISSDLMARTSKPIVSKTIFGIDKSKFNELKEIVELQEVFGFNEFQSQAAYYIHATYDISLNDAFAFVDEFYYNEQDSVLDPSDCSDREFDSFNFFDRIKGAIDDYEVRYVYFECDIDSIYTVYNVINKLHNAGEEDVTKVDIDVINICAYEEINVAYCKRAVEYFKEHATDKHGEDAFDEYIDMILCNKPIEIAFANIIQLEDIDDYTLYTPSDLEDEDSYIDLYEEPIREEDYEDYKDETFGFWENYD